MKKLRLSLDNKHSLFGLIFMLPGFLGFVVFILIPLLFAVYYSAFNSGGRFALINNFDRLFASYAFLIALKNTGLYLLVGGGLNILFSLAMAVALFSLVKKNVRVASFAKVGFLMPLVVPTGVSVLFVQILFSGQGTINQWLGSQIDWLSTSPYTFWILVLIYVWKNFGYFVVIFLVAFAAIPTEVYDAAKCDGAGALRSLFSIILPQIVPSLFFAFIMGIIGVFKMNRESYLLFGDYPNESAYMFQNFIKNNLDNMEFSRAACSSVIFLLFFSIMVFLMINLSERAD